MRFGGFSYNFAENLNIIIQIVKSIPLKLQHNEAEISMFQALHGQAVLSYHLPR
jgi:hypothetical protein